MQRMKITWKVDRLVKIFRLCSGHGLDYLSHGSHRNGDAIDKFPVVISVGDSQRW